MDAKIADMRRMAQAMPKDRASGKLATDSAASMLMELRRLLTPTPPLVLVAQLWNLGFIAMMVEVIAALSPASHADRDIIKALLGIVGHSAMAGQFDRIPVANTVLQLCASLAAATFIAPPESGPAVRVGWPEQQHRAELRAFIGSALEVLGRIGEMRVEVARDCLRSKALLTVLATEDPDVARAGLVLLFDSARNFKAEVKAIGLAHAAELAEEFCFFLVEGEREFEAEMAAKLLLAIVTATPAVVQQLRQYGSISDEIHERWADRDNRPTGRPIVSTIEQLSSFFRADRRTLEKAERGRSEHAAAVSIQAAYRGYQSRRRVAKLKPAVAHIEALFLRRKERRRWVLESTQRMAVADSAYADRLRAKRINTRKAEMEALLGVPARKVDEFLASKRAAEQDRAASRIQASWRRQQHLKTASSIRTRANLDASAKVIQQAFRSYRARQLSQRGKGKGKGQDWFYAPEQRVLPGLTEARRKEHTDAINRRYKDRTPTLDGADIEAVQRLYSSAHRDLLGVINRRAHANAAHDSRGSLIEVMGAEVGRLQLQLLKGIDAQLAQRTRPPITHDKSIRTDAGRNHRAKMREMRKPWWQREEVGASS